ncbi:carboxymuconolactone decarboxylase family protein [Lentibacillus sp. N15]|uniref:carboxymuconolactone decarboxylase family protein n=1 Tax=Lentibacillus songyuanensis TaxID=3136161 RepID=UPI0031BA689F
MAINLYQRGNMENLNQLKDFVPDQMQAFSTFNEAVFKEGALTNKQKEIIAVSVAHVTECPYCIDSHTRKAKAAGASLKELVEAVFVVSAVEAGGAVTHSTNMHSAKDTEAPDTLYQRSNLKKLGQLSKSAPNGFKGYSNFSATVMKDGELSAEFKEIIAVAVAHATLCPYCIDVHTKNADKAGATEEELSEAVLVASALLAGGSYAHMANMIQSFNDEV